MTKLKPITTAVYVMEPLLTIERRSPESIKACKVADLIFRNELAAAIHDLNETQAYRLHELFNHHRYAEATVYLFDELNILKARKDNGL